MKEGKLRHAVGVDFGGTFIKMALVNEKGEVRSRAKIPTKEVVGLDKWMDAVYGGQKYETDFHKRGWTKEMLIPPPFSII